MRPVPGGFSTVHGQTRAQGSQSHRIDPSLIHWWTLDITLYKIRCTEKKNTAMRVAPGPAQGPRGRGGGGARPKTAMKLAREPEIPENGDRTRQSPQSPAPQPTQHAARSHTFSHTSLSHVMGLDQDLEPSDENQLTQMLYCSPPSQTNARATASHTCDSDRGCRIALLALPCARHNRILLLYSSAASLSAAVPDARAGAPRPASR